MAPMFKRLGGWWQLWIALTVMWTIVVITYGWINLPRAHQMPHNPQFLSKLSSHAASILFASEAKAEPARGALVWSQTPMIVRMSNGARLTFPATTSGERVALVTGEYSQLLNAEASERRGLYMLGVAVVWLLPCVTLLVVGLVTRSIYANGELFRVMFANEQRKPQERATIAPIAAIDKRNADYAVAKEKCDVFAGDAKNCLTPGNTAGVAF